MSPWRNFLKSLYGALPPSRVTETDVDETKRAGWGPMPSAGLRAESHESHPAVGEAPLRGHSAPSLGDGSIGQSQIRREGMPAPLGTTQALRYPALVPKSRLCGLLQKSMMAK